MFLVNRISRYSITAIVAVVALVAMASTAAAFNPRVPQVTVNGGTLQGYLTGVGQTINVGVDQLDAQMWTSTISGNSTFTLMIELTGNAAANAIGVYNSNSGPVPTLRQIFPGAATTGWFATAHFAGGNMIVSLFDNNAVFQGQTGPFAVDANGFSFYLARTGTTIYGQDVRNASGAAKVLTYAATGSSVGTWWECFEDTGAGADNDFDDAILSLESVNPTSAHGRTWGAIKTLYRQ
jgi:hypothetical protein